MGVTSMVVMKNMKGPVTKWYKFHNRFNFFLRLRSFEKFSGKTG